MVLSIFVLIIYLNIKTMTNQLDETTQQIGQKDHMWFLPIASFEQLIDSALKKEHASEEEFHRTLWILCARYNKDVKSLIMFGVASHLHTKIKEEMDNYIDEIKTNLPI